MTSDVSVSKVRYDAENVVIKTSKSISEQHSMVLSVNEVKDLQVASLFPCNALYQRALKI